MQIVRPVNVIDIPAIERLLVENGVNVTSLPQDRDRLAEIVSLSTKSFNLEQEAVEFPFFMFVLEDLETGSVIGVCGLEASAGSGYPFFNYRLEDLIHASHHLEVKNQIPVLHLSHELTGSTVLKSFAMKPEHKHTDGFALLVRARLMFYCAFQSLFSDRLCTEIQGVLNEQGESEFWNSIGQKFFDIDFATADYYAGVKSKTFIAELMPQHPIYLPLLSPEAQETINREHPQTAMNCQLFFAEGFTKTRFVDIFDGGPVLMAQKQSLKTFKDYHAKQIKVSHQVGGLKYLISNQSLRDFRCVIGNLVDGVGDTVRINPEIADALQLEAGSVAGYSML
ncbi:arginine N-succinyltransferase [Gynuella sunshinyii]|uniref:Arginine/ornithine N-succinyltransferase beta subunit n=1 Tax=Gynuella sunshinyii YC6258 TaxID=1445510 RepID=A0A0C5VTX0_9GAMM|nr:arginine N-succinyltransferase [Gynuella sunshinyii]AJQ97631.1 arginine/ornithine N-succinyltransferase beta subunit [Gynuella sunshinyii YC6258]